MPAKVHMHVVNMSLRRRSTAHVKYNNLSPPETTFSFTVRSSSNPPDKQPKSPFKRNISSKSSRISQNSKSLSPRRKPLVPPSTNGNYRSHLSSQRPLESVPHIRHTITSLAKTRKLSSLASNDKEQNENFNLSSDVHTENVNISKRRNTRHPLPSSPRSRNTERKVSVPKSTNLNGNNNNINNSTKEPTRNTNFRRKKLEMKISAPQASEPGTNLASSSLQIECEAENRLSSSSSQPHEEEEEDELANSGQEDAMSCEESSPDERMSCDEDDLGHNISPPIELSIPHILDNQQNDSVEKSDEQSEEEVICSSRDDCNQGMMTQASDVSNKNACQSSDAQCDEGYDEWESFDPYLFIKHLPPLTPEMRARNP